MLSRKLATSFSLSSKSTTSDDDDDDNNDDDDDDDNDDDDDDAVDGTKKYDDTFLTFFQERNFSFLTKKKFLR